jgi:hypothetical protein
LQPIDGKILHLSPKGDLIEIPVPVENNQFSKKRSHYYKKKKTSPMTQAKSKKVS